MAKLWARPVHGVLILAKGGRGGGGGGGGGGPDPLGPMLDPPLCQEHGSASIYSRSSCDGHSQTHLPGLTSTL